MTLDSSANPHLIRGIDRLLSVQRPVVLAHIRAIRRGRHDASPEEVIRVLERRYLATVTTGGAAVGASAVLPAVGVATSLALSGVETAAFLEASALFAQSVTEVHGIVVDDPDRARALVMTMMLGSGGTDLVRQLAGQVSGVGPTRTLFWGDLVTKSLPSTAMGHIADQIKRSFLKRFVATQSTNIVGRIIPFGIGAVIGGTGNNLLGRRVVSSSRQAFGAPPELFPLELEPREKVAKAPKAPRQAESGIDPQASRSIVSRIPKLPSLPSLPARLGGRSAPIVTTSTPAETLSVIDDSVGLGADGELVDGTPASLPLIAPQAPGAGPGGVGTRTRGGSPSPRRFSRRERRSSVAAPSRPDRSVTEPTRPTEAS